MSKTKAGKTTKGSRDARPKYLGIKHYGGEVVTPGSIIVRQRGSTFRAGANVGTGRDYTLFATIQGTVTYYDRSGKKYISVTPAA